MTGDCADYWLLRLQHAVESAAGAASERSRAAFLDLACHYWSMHKAVHGLSSSDHPAVASLTAAMSSPVPPELRWAA